MLGEGSFGLKFLVEDTQAHRHATIRSFLTEDAAVIAVLLAAVDLEWTLRRAIYILGQTPIKDLKEKKIAGLEQYRAFWKKEVAADSSEELGQLIGDWQALKQAFELRNELIHGKRGTTGRDYAARKVDRMTNASKQIFQFVQKNRGDVGARLRRVRSRV
jgi:hypothetical protein